ncbi:MAG: hypothetical protein FWF36_08175 [Propionibacteriaceae bacterium]|nr:hypothetical protein [Propionibacteriaceae bacterium]
MNTWKSMPFRHRTAYFIALGKILFDRRLSTSSFVEAANEAFELAWDGWLVHDVGDVLRFESLCADEERPVNLFVPLCTASDAAEQAAWRCLMNMVLYAGYFYSEVRGIWVVPVTIENIPAVDLCGQFDADFDSAVEGGDRLRVQVLDFLATTSGDTLNQRAILDFVADLDRNV